MFGRKAAAEVIRDKDMKPEMLVERVVSINTSFTLLESMAAAARSFAKPQAAQEIAAEVINIAQKNRAKTNKRRHEGASI
jgi:UDP-N-acetylglucosamine:LPS N-acetylglucosamine transferase